MITIASFSAPQARHVADLILAIQREEFGFAITLDDQPDLKEIPEFYQSGSGGFWLALEGDRVIGTIGLRDIGGGNGALRKMFVASDRRGAEHRVAHRLLGTLLDHARAHGLSAIWLGTTEKFRAAHRFYEKNGFEQIEKAALPANFPFMVDTRFYRFTIDRS